VLLIDDGLATGATMEAAVLSARERKARRVLIGVPIASPSAAERIRRLADELHALYVDPDFAAVGQYYDIFPQTTDDEVLRALTSEV